jgi:heptosyltransferase-2
MSKIAVIKPDHIGDFILSLPAFRAIGSKFNKFDLYSSPGNKFLYDYFLGTNINFCPVRLKYLQKDSSGIELDEFVYSVKDYDLIFLLRNDEFSCQVAERLKGRVVLTGDGEGHETLIQKRAIAPIVGSYSRQSMMWASSRRPHWPRNISNVGLSLSAGFFANKIPLIIWLETASTLIKEFGVGLKLIGGPLEHEELRQAARILGIEESRIVVGDSSLNDFFTKINDCDLVVGADSGTMHLISTLKPVLGVFTSSPWERFAPFGEANRIVYADVSCRPCIQFSKNAYNACLVRECSSLIKSSDLISAIFNNQGFEKYLSRNVSCILSPSSH